MATSTAASADQGSGSPPTGSFSQHGSGAAEGVLPGSAAVGSAAAYTVAADPAASVDAVAADDVAVESDDADPAAGDCWRRQLSGGDGFAQRSKQRSTAPNCARATIFQLRLELRHRCLLRP